MADPEPEPDSYSGDPSSCTRDAVRDAIGDIDNSNLRLTNKEIDYALAQAGENVLQAAYRCALKLAARYSSKVSKSIAGSSVSFSDLASQYRALAADLKAQYQQSRMSFTMPTISRVRDSTDMPVNLLHSDIKRSEWTDENQTNEDTNIEEIPR